MSVGEIQGRVLGCIRVPDEYDENVRGIRTSTSLAERYRSSPRTRHLQHAGTCEVQREMHQRQRTANIFKSRKIKEQEVTLELILPKFSGK